MENLETYAAQLNRLPADIRAEVLLADLLESGLSPEDLLVNPVGLFRRNFQNDVGQVTLIETPRTHQQKLQLSVNRDGLYDALPEGLFHQPTNSKAPEDKPEVLREIKRQQEREAAARRFFLPLEQEYYMLRTRLVLEERQYLFDSDTFFENNLFAEFWNFPPFLTAAQMHNLLYLLPMMHRLAGDWEQIRLSLETVLEDAVTILPAQALHHRVTLPNPVLGAGRLGVDWILGDLYEEVCQSVILRVTPASPERILYYLPGNDGGQLVDYLASYLLPLETDFQVEIAVPPECHAFALNDTLFNTRLGYTTYL